MKLFKRLFCKHRYKTITNLYGDIINTFDCRSILECTKCGKWVKSGSLDMGCDMVNFHKKEV